MVGGGRALGAAALAAASLTLGAPAVAADPGEDAEVGHDVSFPQCDDPLPDDPAFAVVGVDGGLATRPNPCLAEQLAWAAEETTGAVAAQPRLQLYVNTANPGQVRHQVTTWPGHGRTPYGRCQGTNSRACSWQYGWQRAAVTVTEFFAPAAEAAGVDPDPGSTPGGSTSRRRTPGRPARHPPAPATARRSRGCSPGSRPPARRSACTPPAASGGGSSAWCRRTARCTTSTAGWPGLAPPPAPGPGAGPTRSSTAGTWS